MFPKTNRLPTSQFLTVLRTGTRHVSPLMQVIVLPNGLSVSRFGVIVSIHIDKRATVRNRIKRLIRESVRMLLAEIPRGYAVVIRANRNFSDRKQPSVMADMQKLTHLPTGHL